MSVKNKKVVEKTAEIPENVADSSPVRFAFVPILREFRGYTKKNEARLWIPVTTSLLTRYEFASCSLQTRYVFVAIVLYCGGNGLEEIPLDSTFLSSVLVADYRTVEKSLEELLSKELLILSLEREKERKEKKDTDRQKETRSAPVSVNDSNLFQNENQNEEKEVVQKNNGGRTSQFSLDECRRYVEEEVKDGRNIDNPNALAMTLFKTGQSDGFIMAKLYPEQAAVEQFGDPVQFTEYPCKVCFGAKQAEIDDGRFGKCLHCRNERGVATGLEPISE